MSKKHHGGPGPVPPANRPHSGTSYTPDEENENQGVEKDGEVPFQQEDPKRRMGDFTGTGEHSIQEPGGKKDSDRTTIV